MSTEKDRADDSEADDEVATLINWTRTQRFGDQGLRLKMEQIGNVLGSQQVRVQELERENARLERLWEMRGEGALLGHVEELEREVARLKDANFPKTDLP